MNAADGSGQHLLLSEADYDDEAPAFSPDAVWVIFKRCPADFTDCAIYKIRTDGSGLTQVTDFQRAIYDSEAQYSPDGMSIILQSFNREGLIADSGLMNADARDLHPLIPPELVGTDPQWSPDGEKIAFASHCCTAQTADIWVIDRDGKDLHRLTGSHETVLALPAPYSNGAPSWSPHGRAIVFNQYTPTTNTNAILVINADGSERRQVMTPVAHPRVSSRATTEASHGNKRRHVAREIERGGVWPRWSPELQ
jgi:Tol biopolymer transport system component